LGIMYNLLPLNRLETEHYIHKRLSVAGAPEVDIFRSDALDEIFSCAKGFPRLINIICDNALLFGSSTNTYHLSRDIIRRVAKDMDISTLEEDVTPDSGLLTRAPARTTEPRTVPSPVVPPTLPPPDLRQPDERTGSPAPQPEVREDADRIIRRHTVFSEDNYWDYWESLLHKNPRKDNNLISTWKQAAERESRQRLRRFLLIAVVLLGLLGGIVGEQLGLWSLRAIVDRAVEMVRQRVSLVSGVAGAPEVGGRRCEGGQRAPLNGRLPPTVTSGRERASAGPAVPPAPQERARVPAPPAQLPSSQLQVMAPVQPRGEAKELTIKKVVVIRSGDTLSHILAQEYGEYTKAVVDLVSEANPGLRNIHFLEIGQRLILPERPE